MSQEPQVIAEIPQDIGGSSGNILSSDVYGLVGARKRKRSELAVAVDHQGINIYNFRQSRLASSYAISPQATFTCPPHSLRYGASDGNSAYRTTFCSLKSPNARLYRFKEVLNPGSSLDKSIVTSFVDLQEKISPIIQLETKSGYEVDGLGTSTNCLLAVHQNGRINCYTENLEQEVWSSPGCAGADQQVLLATLTSVAQLERGFLKHRGDVLAPLGPIESSEQTDLLILLTRPRPIQSSKEEAPKLSLQILDISKRRDHEDWSAFKPRQVFSVELPRADHVQSAESDFTINLASGYIYQRTPDSVTAFDMTDLLPKVAHEVVVGENDVASFLRLSSHSLALSKQSSLVLVSLPYCSIQGESSAEAVPAAGDGKLRLLSYFESLNIIAAIKGRSLIAMQLPKSTSGPVVSKKRKREGTLADSIGRGSYAKYSIPHPQETPDLSIQSLGDLSNKSLDDAWETKKVEWADLPVNELSKAVIEDFDMGKTGAGSTIDQRRVRYIISRIFTVQRPKSSEDAKSSNGMRLIMKFPIRHIILKWLIQAGYLARHIVEDALRQNKTLHGSEFLASTSIIDLLLKEDRSLKLLTTRLSSPIPLDPLELAAALSAVIQSHPSTVKNPRAPNPPTPNQESLSLPTSTYESLIRLLLARFFPLPSSIITAALRTQVPQPTLLSLIDALRLQIATAGWFTPYDNQPFPPSQTPTPNDHLTQTTHLLNSTLDALGAGGWILGTSSSTIRPSTNPTNPSPENPIKSVEPDAEAEAANTLTYMTAEIAAALEGIHEAVYLQGMLSEVLLCGKDTLSTQSNKERKKTQEVLVKVEGAALPLGLKRVKVIEKTVGGGGGVLKTRTYREIERARSRAVGEYAFERLRV